MFFPLWWLFAVAFYLGAGAAVVTCDSLHNWPIKLLIILLGLALAAMGARYFLLKQGMQLILSTNRAKVEERCLQLNTYWVPDEYQEGWKQMTARVVELRTPVTLAKFQPGPKWEPYWDGVRRLVDQIRQAQGCLEQLDSAENRLDAMHKIWVAEQLITLPDTIQKLMPDETDQRAMASFIRRELQQHLEALPTIKRCADHLLEHHLRDRKSWGTVLHWVNETTALLEAARELPRH